MKNGDVDDFTRGLQKSVKDQVFYKKSKYAMRLFDHNKFFVNNRPELRLLSEINEYLQVHVPRIFYDRKVH